MHDLERLTTPLTRRRVIALGAGAFALASVPFLRRPSRLTRRSLPVMGTIAEIAVVHRDSRRAHAAIDAAFAELDFVDRTMSRFRAISDIGRANAGAMTDAVSIDRATYGVLEESLRWAERTDGKFDPCIGRAMMLWDVGSRRQPPADDRVRRLAGRRLYRALDLGRHRGTPAVRFHDPEVAIDLGGIAKGYAVDRAVQALREHGIADGLVNVGGDLYALGRSADGDPWRVGIRSPENPDRLIGELGVSDEAIATSGDYLQYFEHAGRRYHHLLDPQSGAPRTAAMRSLTIAASTCMLADAAATALFGEADEGVQATLNATASAPRVVHRV